MPNLYVVTHSVQGIMGVFDTFDAAADLAENIAYGQVQSREDVGRTTEEDYTVWQYTLSATRPVRHREVTVTTRELNKS